jgi:hypothetical protein
MYPEDYTIDRSNLERQWMAEGFISKENGQDVEKAARNYFNEIISKENGWRKDLLVKRMN